jgi:NAD(P)-dependent dehydrogenase (short-subunit alcohol dehydrogenase family)
MSNGSNRGDDWLGLTERVCVVTGAAGGIGAETARQFARAGARVALLDLDGAGADRIAAEIRDWGREAVGIAVDIGMPDSVEAAGLVVRAQLGACAILVNNAAVQHAAPLLDLDIDKWQRALQVNLTGTLLCSQVFARQMIAEGLPGCLVHVGSIAGESPRPNGGAYSVSKAGLSMLSRQLAVELGTHRIRSNVVAPGFVHTALSDRIWSDPATAEKRCGMVPAGRAGLTMDLANAVVFLASDRASYVNGQTLLVDGGLNQMLMSMVPRPE